MRDYNKAENVHMLSHMTSSQDSSMRAMYEMLSLRGSKDIESWG